MSTLAVCPALATEPFTPPVRSYTATFLSFPVGVRNLGMGATGAADASGLATGYFNPASVAWSTATTLAGSYERLFTDISLSGFQVTSPISWGADSTAGRWQFGGSLAYTRLGLEPQTQRTIFLPEGVGRTYDADDWMLAALAAARWNYRALSVGAGVASKFVLQKFAEDNVNDWAFDVGLIAVAPMRLSGGLVRPRVGYAALNLDNGSSYDGRKSYVATERRGGVGLDFETLPHLVYGRAVPLASFSFDYDWIDSEFSTRPQFGMGIELSAVNMIRLRYGLIDDDYSTLGVGAGWDYGQVVFRLDYAHKTRGKTLVPDFDGYSNRDDTFGGLVGVRW